MNHGSTLIVSSQFQARASISQAQELRLHAFAPTLKLLDGPAHGAATEDPCSTCDSGSRSLKIQGGGSGHPCRPTWENRSSQGKQSCAFGTRFY